RSTITDWTKELPDDVLLAVVRPQAGRPRKLTDQDAHNLMIGMKRGTFKNSVQATKEFNKDNDNPVSVNTVRRALKRVGGKARKPIKRPLLLN
ncbi:hypothetical protein BGW41_007607, partial [Actinomortierella wolfii]